MKSLSCVQLFTTPWTAAHQAPPSMGFSRQEYWSGVPWPSPQRRSTELESVLDSHSGKSVWNTFWRPVHWPHVNMEGAVLRVERWQGGRFRQSTEEERPCTPPRPSARGRAACPLGLTPHSKATVNVPRVPPSKSPLSKLARKEFCSL